MERLADPYVGSRIRQKIAEVGFNNFGQIDSWADIRIAISPRGAAEPGRTIEEIARERRCDPLDAVCDVKERTPWRPCRFSGKDIGIVRPTTTRALVVVALPSRPVCCGLEHNLAID